MRKYGHLRWLALALALLLPLGAGAQEVVHETALYIADIALETPEEFSQLLDRAEQLLLAGVNIPREQSQVSFVLHGPVLNTLLRGNYLDNKRLVDLAASLSAMRVIELKACRTWMSSNGIQDAQLLPFVETVDYAPKAVRALVRDESRIYF
ncbi:MAG: intracellular sulfur oxidation DsrE/DsrF family protein [Bacteroidia bacterium]|jgi:intracellular sulfur oxidation DsrE/DsrF family protein